jgi:membrane protein DedA with SNARE-associated domain
MHVLQEISQFVIQLIERLGYAGLFVGMLGQAVGVPLPSELMLGFGGYLAYIHSFTYIFVVLVGAAGDTAGAILAYVIGYYGGRPLLLRFGKTFFIAQRELAAADRWFARFGNRAVLICKLLPGIRAFGSYPAGVTRMNFGIFVGYTAIGASIFSLFFVTSGYLLGRHWDRIVEQIKPISIITLSALVVGIVVWLIVRVRTEKARRAGVA